MATEDNLPEFENPPVIEVVCGLQFQPLKTMLAGHLGQLWDHFKPDYSKLKEAAPLPHLVEQYDSPEDRIKLSTTNIPDLPRTWFIHKDDTGVLQVQRDRFLHNWRKVKAADYYPRYHEVIARFREHLATFKGFVDELSLGSLTTDQFELSYINHIPIGDGWNSHGEIGAVLPDFGWRINQGRFLPPAEVFNWRTSFLLPNQTGRLHVTAITASRRSDNRPILFLELSARGMPAQATEDAMWTWFDTAHEWIVKAFADLTGEQMHRIWKRTK